MESNPNSPAQPTMAEVTAVDYWRSLCPALTISDTSTSPVARIPDLRSLSATLRDEGYINLPEIFPSDTVSLLREGIQRLVDRGVPPPFAFVYDEYWTIFQGISTHLSEVLGAGYQMLPDIWAWHVKPSNDASGWPPHRDRPKGTLDPDNTPRALTVWLPLTDATPLNGCMYVLPARYDSDLHAGTVPDGGIYRLAGADLQNIRALPAPAGSLLAWSQALLHWGGRASHLATTPRCSIAAQFQRGNLPAFEAPLLDPRKLPPFAARIGLIGHLICGFSGFLNYPAEIRLLATALKWKYWSREATPVSAQG